MADQREVMDIHEASHYLGISRETLYNYLGERKIPAFKLGNRWRFKKTVLDLWMEKASGRGGRRETSTTEARGWLILVATFNWLEHSGCLA